MVERQTVMSRQGLMKAAHLLERDIKASLSETGEPGSQGRDSKGKFTKRSGGASSAPGTPPHLQSGDLRRSIQVDDPVGLGGARWSVEVGPTVEYGRIQELGGVAGRGAVLPPRPYVAPALERMGPAMAAVMREAWRAGLRG